jgi:hypothetical protein
MLSKKIWEFPDINNFELDNCEAVLGIRDISVRFRIHPDARIRPSEKRIRIQLRSSVTVRMQKKFFFIFSNLRTFIRIHWYTVPPTFQFTVWEDGFDYIVFFQMGILDMIQHFMH